MKAVLLGVCSNEKGSPGGGFGRCRDLEGSKKGVWFAEGK